MKASVLCLMAAVSLPLAGCSSMNNDRTVASADTGASQGYVPASAPPTCRSVGGTAVTGAAVGGAGGLAVGALTGGSLLAGALIGAAVGGLAGAVWADQNNDGCVDGYVREGRYYEGEPVVQPTDNYRRTGERG